MTDLEMTKLCARSRRVGSGKQQKYDPLHDDAQAMWLVKNCSLTLTNVFESSGGNFIWRVEKSEWNNSKFRFMCGRH